jgi:uncharacterized membrane protein YgcG
MLLPACNAAAPLVAARATERGLTVLASVVVFRHGDRSPALNFFAAGGTDSEDARAEELGSSGGGSGGGGGTPGSAASAERAEASLWALRVADAATLAKLQQRVPVVRVKNGNGVAHVAANVAAATAAAAAAGSLVHAPASSHGVHDPDPAEQPFGRITRLGLEQCFERGRALRERYAGVFSHSDVLCFSTNFSRTQASAQSLLHGLLSAGGSGGPKSLAAALYEEARNERAAAAGDGGNIGVLPPTGAAGSSIRRQPPVPVLVAPSSEDINNSWDAHESLRAAVQHAQRHDPVYEELERGHAAARQAMTAHLPVYTAQPSRFLWVYACDYFICRHAHELPLAPELKKHQPAVLDHATTRFLRWYHDPVVLGLAAGDMLRTVRELLRAAGAEHHGASSSSADRSSSSGGGGGGSSSRSTQPERESHDQRRGPAQLRKANGGKRLFLYSGHDISVLPLLCALDAFGLRCAPPRAPSPRWSHANVWPKYSATLVFELLAPRARDGPKPDSLLVRVLYEDAELVTPTPFAAFWRDTVWLELDQARV